MKRGMAGRRRNVYRLPSQQVPSSPRVHPLLPLYCSAPMRLGHNCPPNIVLSAYPHAPKPNAISPPVAAACCVSACSAWGRMGLEVIRGRKTFLPPPPLACCTSACRKLFVHRHNASLFESSRGKTTVLSLCWF